MTWGLIKVNLSALFASAMPAAYKRKGKAKAKPIKVVLIALLVIYIAAALMFGVGALFFNLSEPFFSAGIGWFYFALVGLLVFSFCFITGVFMVQTQIFNSKDNELLLSMPIKPKSILLGRICSLLVVEYVFELLIMIPAFAVLLARGSISLIPAFGIVLYAASAVLLPLGALTVGCLIGWLVALASSRMRNKNIITIVLSVAFLAAYFWAYSQMMNYMSALIMNGAEIAEAVRRAAPPAYYLGVAAANGNFLYFLAFAACMAVPFALMCVLLSLSFVKLTTGGRAQKKVKYREKAARASGAGTALIKREMRGFFSMPTYIMNSALGAIFTVVLAGVLIVKPRLITGAFAQLTAIMPGLAPGTAGAVVLTALALLNFISAPSISLEGKTLWILKSLPVRPRDILISKALSHAIICQAASLLAAAAMIAAFGAGGIVRIILLIVLPASANLFIALAGVMMNLTFHRFDWINPIQPIKQGASCILTMFGGMVVVLTLALVYIFAIGPALSLETYMLICAAVFAAASAGLYAYLARAGSRKFEEL